MLEIAASNVIVRALILIGIFGLVAIAVFAIYGITSRRMRVSRDLAALSGDIAGINSESLTRQKNEGAWARMVKRIEESGLNLGDTDESKLAKLLREAGYISPSAPRVYTLVRLMMIFLLPGAYLLSVALQSEAPTALRMYFTCAFLALLGLYIPALFVRAKADRRRQEIINGFPDCLDLMLVCVEAGLGLESALDRVGREMATTHPLISGMLTETNLLMRAGATREDALRKLGEVAGVDEIKSFATLLIQSDKLGTSLAATLRVYSAEMRESRRLRAEEKAHRLPVLLSIPLVVFMLPTMIGVLILPAVIMSIRKILPSMGGG